MENRVGDNAPTPEAVSQLVTQLTAIITQLKTFGIILTPDERKFLLHARRDADPMVQRVHKLAVKHSLNLKDIPLTGMMNDLNLRAIMHPLTDLFRTGLALADDTEGQAESEMWEAFLAYYNVLSTMAEQDADLALELKPVVEFMARRRRTQAPKGPKES